MLNEQLDVELVRGEGASSDLRPPKDENVLTTDCTDFSGNQCNQ
jgi:hypothetical protein